MTTSPDLFSGQQSLRQRLLRILYVMCQVTWGFVQSLLGFTVWCFHVGAPHSFYRGAIVTYWNKRGALSLGLFLFLPHSSYIDYSRSSLTAEEIARKKKLHEHEYGHSVQSLFLGPLYLFCIGIPSLVWAGFPPLARQWREGKRDYYSFFTERLADYLSRRFPEK
ncbi:MAG: hypothetical protein IKZ87_04850 [Actinomycetaceae bacterium]|nr:hypothetical protein [Actinomycetaceae bacterium]